MIYQVYRQASSNDPLRASVVALNAIVSGFIGFAVGDYVEDAFPEMAYALVAAAGLWGLPALRFAERWMPTLARRRLGLPVDADEADEDLRSRRSRRRRPRREDEELGDYLEDSEGELRETRRRRRREAALEAPEPPADVGEETRDEGLDMYTTRDMTGALAAALSSLRETRKHRGDEGE